MEVPGEGERVTVRVSSRRPVRAKLVDEPLTGYVVDTADVDTALERSDAGFTIAASRHGEELGVDRLDQLVERRDAAGHMTVAFGAPERGLPAIFGLDPDDAVTGGAGDNGAGFDLWLNTVPNQGSEVVRTEEAMFATLASLTLTE